MSPRVVFDRHLVGTKKVCCIMPPHTQVTDVPSDAPRSRKGAATRARLVESAKEEFEETGFLETRISDIAKRAGMSHGTFYHYFDSKEQIFREVAEAQEALLTAPDDGDEPHPEATEFDRILRANRRYLDRYRSNGKIMGVIEEVSRYDTFVNDARMRRQKHFAERAEASVRRLQAKGVADLDVDPEIAAVALGSMIARFAELWLVEDWGDYEFDHAADQVSKLWANAIGLPVESAAKDPGAANVAGKQSGKRR
jgi:AcrR family transcriptional regulator